VLSAPNARVARQLFTDHSQDIQLLLTDVMMPGGVSGIELASMLRKSKPELRIVLSSGQSQDVVTRNVEWAAGAHFLQKPYPALDLLRLLARLLG
jgi:CheY-like chemotaxis protein